MNDPTTHSGPPREAGRTEHPENPSSGRSRLFTYRSLVLGTLLTLVISVVFTYARLVMGAAGLSDDYITSGAIFLFFLLTALVNPVIKLFRRSWGFSRAELVVICVMMIVASTIPTWGFSGHVVAMLPAVYFFAAPENNWSELVHPHIKSWMVIQDPEAIESFFEGLPEGAPIPWGEWVVPMAAWCSLILAVYLMMIASVVLVRRQWMDHERLSFPLVQLPLEMIEEDRSGDGVRSPFLRDPLMWLGFLVPFTLMSMVGLNHYHPGVPEPNLYQHLAWFGPSSGGLNFVVSFAVIGLAYFLSLDVALSMWLFLLLAKVQMGIEGMVGYQISGDIEMFMEGTLTLAHQGMGAMMALVFWGLYVSRTHLRQVARKVLFDSSEIDDSGEILSYRTSALILLVCGLYVTAWLNAAGVPLWVTVVFLFLAFAIFYGITRIIAEGGVGFMRPQMTAQPIAINFLGADAVTAPGIANLAFTYSWAGNLRILLMASVINGMKMAERVGVLRRPLFWAMLLAIVVSLVSSVLLIIWLGYRDGGINLERYAYQYMGRGVAEFTVWRINNPLNFADRFDTLGPRLLYTGVGAAVMSALIFLRHHFLWWPTHYLGFAISATHMMEDCWFGILIGWLCKTVILKYGGIRPYRRLRLLFLGFILGQITATGFWTMLDFLLGGTGNYVPVFMYRW